MLKEKYIEFKSALANGMQKGIELNEFIREYVDLNKVDKEFPMFLVNFKDNIEKLIPEDLKK
jgi:hypothetical protein